MSKEFKKIKSGKDTRYVLESASGGGTSSGSIASVSSAMGGTRKRGDNLLAQEAGNKKEAPKPRNFVAKNAKMGGAGKMKDKAKTIPRKEKHKKPAMEALKNQLDTLKEAFGRYGSRNPDTMSSGDYDRYQQDQMDYGKRAFKRAEMDHELGHERNNYAVAIDGRTWKVFADQRQAQNIARSLQAKGKNATVHETGAEPTAEGVAEDAPFGSNYAEQLAQQVFDHNPNLDNEDKILNLGYNIAKSDLGSRAQGIFRDEDFPGDFVSAYGYLKKQGVAEGFDGEYDDEAGMSHSNLHTIARAAQGLLDTIDDKENLPEWAQEKIAKVEGMLVSVWDYLQSQEEQGIDPQQGVAEGDGPRYIDTMMDKYKAKLPGQTPNPSKKPSSGAAKTDDKLRAYYAARRAEKEKQQGTLEGDMYNRWKDKQDDRMDKSSDMFNIVQQRATDRANMMSRHSHDNRERSHQRHQDKLDKMHQDFMGSPGLGSSGRSAGGSAGGSYYGDEEKAHQAQQRMNRDEYDTQRRKDDDEDTRQTMNMFRDRLNRMQYKNQRDVDPKQLAKISAVKYEPKQNEDAYMESLAESLATVLQEKAPPGDKYERMVKHIKKGYSKDGKLSDKEKSIAYATAWKSKNKAKK